MGISALTPPSAEDIVETVLEFPDNRLLIDLCGEFDRNLAQIEHQMGVHILRRGNRLAVIGDKGIDERVPERFWNDAVGLLKLHFAAGKQADGLCEAVALVGEKLAAFFPLRRDDTNELSNEVSIGKP